MAYNGYLLQFYSNSSSYIFPHEYIKADTYLAYLNMQDVDPWTDANGYLHRTAVELKAFKIEFETIPMLTDTQLTSIMRGFKSVYHSQKDRTLYVEAYIPETDTYVTQKAYLADFQPQIYGIFDNVIKYNPIRFAIIGGVAE